MLLTRKRGTLGFPELADLSWFPFVEPVIRIEEYQNDDQYVVRAEIPGVDPAKDVSILTEDGVLRLGVVRLEETISATYTNGILEITMQIGEPKHIGRTIPIAVTNGQPKPVKKS